MALYENGKRISGIRDFPAYTWAEYHALPVAKRPKVWKCTDRDYTEIGSWKFLQAVNGNTSISLPAQWSDLQIIAYQSTNIFDFNISHVAADYYHTNIDSRMMFAGGRYATSSAYNSILIDLYESSINIRSSYRNGSDDLANSKLIVFYK